MKSGIPYIALFGTGCLILSSCAPKIAYKPPKYDYSGMNKITRTAHERVEDFIYDSQKPGFMFPVSPLTRIDSLKVNESEKVMDIYLNKIFSHEPFRPDDIDFLYTWVRKKLGRKFRDYAVSIRSLEQPIEQLVPNFYRENPENYDLSRVPDDPLNRPKPLILDVDRSWEPKKGLLNRNIVVWHSHGWYYSIERDRWEWQRPRLFQTVEDLLPMSFTLPYLFPMLENAGATVFTPRERDTQVREVVIDNDSFPNDSVSVEYVEETQDTLGTVFESDSTGFAYDPQGYDFNVNPFKLGTYRKMAGDTAATATIKWTPEIPETGYYSVSVSYASLDSCTEQARYAIYHLGGREVFEVNQCIGGSTWIYLGNFKFRAGSNPDSGRVELSNHIDSVDRFITADAVRFGGGMGNIKRNGMTSGRPRFMEGARYYLQYAGMPDTLVFDLNESIDDYRDDYQSRGEYVNYLRGAPFGPNKDREVEGLGIPIDLSIAFHTDAGITQYDTTIGTLSIYSIVSADTQIVFPDSMSRLANRDLADIMQTQIIEDMRAKYHPEWRRRALLEAQYSEATRPNVPSMLLELLSHQNYWDMRFALDPRFRFDAARSIYKGILKFISFQNRQEFVIQPLPVTHFHAQFTDSARITLRWRPGIDTLEPGANPLAYMVYTRKNDQGFDNGRLVLGTEFKSDSLQPRVIYSYKVTAINQGGESFPSEVLAVCRNDSMGSPVLIVNGFDRISGPARIEEEKMLGFVDEFDEGVPDRYDINYTGRQFDFSPESEYRMNDAPGLGASLSEHETRIIPGNNFDFAYVHGEALRANGRSFLTVSDEAVMDSLIDITSYRMLDLLLGEERETHWPKSYGDSLFGTQFKSIPERLQRQLELFCLSGGDLFVSGAHIATDLFQHKTEDHPDVIFAENVLKMSWVSDHAASTGGVFSADSLFLAKGDTFSFNAGYDEKIYRIESPDAFNPHGDARTIVRYSENQFSAGIGYKGDYGVIVFGFPFETIRDEDSRIKVMNGILDFLDREPEQLTKKIEPE